MAPRNSAGIISINADIPGTRYLVLFYPCTVFAVSEKRGKGAREKYQHQHQHRQRVHHDRLQYENDRGTMMGFLIGILYQVCYYGGP